MKSLEPPHFDAVTSLAMYQGALISGSRDKNLRRWDLEGDSSYSTVLSAHTDWINALAASSDDRLLYSAGKDSKIRAWRNDEEFNCVGEMSGHTTSVNCLAAMDTSDILLASGGSDRTIRFWRLADEE
jgi:WD40 repeat protein